MRKTTMRFGQPPNLVLRCGLPNTGPYVSKGVKKKAALLEGHAHIDYFQRDFGIFVIVMVLSK